MVLFGLGALKRSVKRMLGEEEEAAPAPVVDPDAIFRIPEIHEINARAGENEPDRIRLNLLIPSVDEAHVFGGISTAIRFFEALREKTGCQARMIVTDAAVNESTAKAPAGYVISSCEEDELLPMQIIPFSDRYGKTIPVTKKDVFVATGWWTADTISEVVRWQEKTFGSANPLIYFIQDFEPGFYPWSSRYMLADSTYRFPFPTYAVINSGFLNDFFEKHGYEFEKSWYFEPMLNPVLKEHLPQQERVQKKKQILVYGRPGTERNAFSLLVYSLKEWAKNFPEASEWTVLSAGEAHDDIELGNGAVLRSLGKLSLEQYAETLLDSYAGISLMVSPHPSYPPLEMSTFGVRTITNRYENKDLSSFNENIVSLSSCSPGTVAHALTLLCEQYDGIGTIQKACAYTERESEFGDIPQALGAALSAEIPMAE